MENINARLGKPPRHHADRRNKYLAEKLDGIAVSQSGHIVDDNLLSSPFFLAITKSPWQMIEMLDEMLIKLRQNKSCLFTFMRELL